MADRHRWWLLGAAIVIGLISAYIPFAIRVRALSECRATGPGWSFPGRVYSDAVPLIVGRMLPVEYLEAQLDARGYRQVPAPRKPGTFAREGDHFEIVLRGFADAPDPDGRITPELVQLRIEGGQLTWIRRSPVPGWIEPAASAGRRLPARLEPIPIALLYDEQPTWRTWADLDRVPQAVRDAVVASEDRRFRSHIGIDLRGYMRALVTNVRAGQVRQGGSTITQQLARSLFLGNERTLGRKLAEVPIALGLEMTLGKRKILEMYLNSVYWGQAGSTSVAGIEAAARWYFDQPVEALGPQEGATLAAIIPAPNVYDPFRRPKIVRARRDQVLRDMAELHFLSPQRAAELIRRPLEVRHGAPPADPFPSYSGFVRDQLLAALPPADVTRHGLAIFTRMDLVWQARAQATLGEAVASLDDRQRGVPPLEGAFVAIEPATGAIRAMVGGRAPNTGSFNRAYQARRQTGSAIKPIVYAAALASGRGLTCASTVPDEPVTFQTDRGPWAPHNDDGTYHSQVTLVKALERSINVATTNVVQLVGPNEIARVAARFGLVGLKPVMSIGLGSNEATLLDLTRAFAVFGDDGWLIPPSSLRAVTDRNGRLVLARPAGAPIEPGTGRLPAGATRALPSSIAALMTGMMTDVVRFGVAYPLRAQFGFLRPAAGKTGTTDDYRDGWFVGFTPDIVAGVWIGYDRPRSLGRLAATTALPAWAQVVPPLLAGFPERPFASDRLLEWHNIEPWSGLLGTPFCSSQPAPFLPGTAPRGYCAPSLPLGPEPDSLGGGADSTGAAEP